MVKMMTRSVIATALSIRKNTLKAMPIRKVIRTVSTIPMTVGVEGILSVPLGIFRYQIRYAGFGKHKLSESLNVLKPDLE